MKYAKAKILVPLEVYNDLKEYLRKETSEFKKFKTTVKVDNYDILLTIEETHSASYKFNMVKRSITVYENGTVTGESESYAQKVSKLLLIFNVNINNNFEFLVNIDKETPNTLEYAKSKLNIMRWNYNNINYIKNHILYSTFSNERELMEVCYLLISNKNLIKSDKELKTIIYNKLNYNGYTKNNNKNYSLENINYMENSKDIIKKVTGRILYDILRFNDYGECMLGNDDTKDSLEYKAYYMYDKYIKKLESEQILETSY